MRLGYGVVLWLFLGLGWSQETGKESQAEIAAWIPEGYYARAEAAARSRVAELDRQNPEGTLETAATLDLLARALIGESAETARVREPLERAIAVMTRILGAEHPALGISLALEAEQDHLRGDYHGAVVRLEHALAVAEKAPGAPPLEVAEILSYLGVALTDSGQAAHAEPVHERALEIRRRELGEENPAVADLLTQIGADRWSHGDVAGAKPYVERAIAMFERTVDEDYPARAYAYATLAGLRKTANDYAGAIPLYERAVAAFERRLPKDSPRLATQLNNLALCLKAEDRWEEATAMLERAVAILEKKYGPDHPRTGVALANLGIAYKETGDFVRARRVYEQALAVQEKRLGPENEHVGSALHSLGLLYKEMRDYGPARRYLTRALAIHEKSLGRDSPVTIQDLQNLAGVLANQGDRAGATQLYLETAGRVERTLGATNPLLAISLLSLGEMSLAAKEYGQAQQYDLRALEIYRSHYGENHHHTAEALAHLGTVAARQGDWAEAARYHRQAVAAWTKSDPVKFARLEGVAGLADDLAHLGQREEAVDRALEAAEIWRDHVRLTIRALPERQALLLAAGGNPGLHLALRFAAEGKGLAAGRQHEIWDALMRDRALVLDEVAARHRAVDRADAPEVAALAHQLALAREHLAGLAVRGPERGGPEFAVRLQRAGSDVEAAEKALAEKALDFRRELQAQRNGYAEIGAALGRHSALVAYARYERDPLGDGSGKHDWRYLAYVLKAGEAAPTVVPLGTAAAIEALVERWRSEIHREAGAMGRNEQWNEQEYRKAGQALRAAVWDPVAAHLGGTTTAYVVPDGALLLVNLNTLPVGDRQYLAERGPLLHTLSTERDLAEAPVERQAHGLLALGNPAFDLRPLVATGPKAGAMRGARSQCADFASLRFDALPASEREVRAIAGIWTGEREESLILSGREATEAELKRNAAGKRVLHLATHGFFLASECPGEQGMEENPLLRSGLALAGANQRKSAGAGQEDGILTAEEVASLNLDGAEWVVLSGCDTGEGEVRAGEGVLGLRRAFRVAGAGTLIASLWQVEDEAARQWMTDLYRCRFGQKRNTAESVAHATLSQLRERRAKGLSTHPFYWGAFVAVGDWR